MKCSCWEENNIILKEWMWAYDWWLALQCDKCRKETHRNWEEVIEWSQVQYWPVYFKCTWNKYYRNLESITKEEYEHEWNN